MKPVFVWLAVAISGLVGFGQACNKTPTPSSSTAAAASVGGCKPGVGATGSPQTIEQAVTLLNSLPAPVTVDCFLQSLDRPIYIEGTDSTLSVQPAVGPQNPRVFVLSGPLTIAVAASGAGKNLIEFGLQVPGGLHLATIKGQINMPLTGPIDFSVPYSSIALPPGAAGASFTTCGSCHTSERAAVGTFAAPAYQSNLIVPQANTVLSVSTLRATYASCDTATNADQCAFFSALFDYGEVLDGEL